MPDLIAKFGLLAGGYDVLFCDVWGVVHNGVAAFPQACEALIRFRRAGGTVILITNAPRPGASVQPVLDDFGVPREAYDAIVSSGDVTRGIVVARPDRRVFHLGPQRDLPIFDGLDVEFAPSGTADYVVCSGLFDDTTETPADYRELLSAMRARALFMVCANPDIVVERGDTLVYCAGALADAYAELGGEVLYCGKPHAPIYHAALAEASALRGAMPPRSRVLAIGDSIRTDLRGAASFGVDCLFVVSGIHGEEIGGSEASGLARLDAAFAAANVAPIAVVRRLEW
ncbi:MAG: TIGR01459 family HAD-type hydrolase [Hyphomicrobiales bacterium]|nr:TIGR01459 family HAD-type hydrolase [Hyphomicrobiales bacterium]